MTGGLLPPAFSAAVLLYVTQMPEYLGPKRPVMDEWDMFRRSTLPWLKTKDARLLRVTTVHADIVAASAFIRMLLDGWHGEEVPGGLERVVQMLEHVA